MSYILESDTIAERKRRVNDNDSVRKYIRLDSVDDRRDVRFVRYPVCDRFCDCKDCFVYCGLDCDILPKEPLRKFVNSVGSVYDSISVRATLALTGVQTVTGTPVYDDRDENCTRGNQLKGVAYSLFSQRDLNKMSTATLITKDYDKKFNASWRRGTKMRGRTQFGKYSFPFPVQCTTREFSQFLAEIMKLTRDERQSMLIEGVVASEALVELYAKIFPRVRTDVYSLCMDDLFTGIEFLSTIILIFDSIMKKDVRTLGLLFTQQSRLIAVVAEYMGSNFSSFKEYCLNMFHDDPISNVQSNDVGSPADWMSILPGYLKQSPLVQKVIKLAGCLMSVQFIKDSSLWQYLITLASPDFSGISTTAFCSALFYQVVTAFWEGFKRMENFTDWRNLIGISKDAYFKESVQEIQSERLGSCTQEEILEKISRIDELLLSRKGLMDSSDIERKIHYLVERKKTLYSNLEDYRPRKKPILIWLNGPPGTGKTTLMNALSDFLAKRDGFARKLGDTVIYNIHDKYPVEAAANYDAKFVQINDIANNYKQFQMEGKVPLDILLQQMIDTSPLTFQAAFEKGVIYNHIKYIFISSNYYSYAFSSDTEKLQRRLEDSIILDIGFRDGNYAKAASRDILERNDCLRATVMKPTCVMDKVAFNHTVVSYSFTEVFEYIARKVDGLAEVRETEHSRFHTTICACGVAPAFHLKDKDYVPISSQCVVADFVHVLDLHCLKGVFKGKHSGEAWRQCTHAQCINDLVLLRQDEEEKADDPIANHRGEVQGLMASAIWYGSVVYTIVSLFPLLLPLKAFVLTYKLYCKSLLFDLLVGVVSHTAGMYILPKWRGPLRTRQIQWGLQSSILKIQLFIRKHKAPISALGVATVVGFGVSRYRPPTSVQGANRQNYNLESLTTTVLKTEQVMATNARSWARVDPIQRLEIQTMNVGVDDLISLVRNNTRPAVFVPADATFGSTGATGFLFSLDSNRVLVNKHYMMSKVDDQYVLRDTVVVLENGEHFKLFAIDVLEHSSCEVVCVTCTHFKTVSNLSKFLPNSFPTTVSFDAVYAPDGRKVVVKAEQVSLSEYDTQYPALCAKLNTAKGDCGNVLIGYHQGSAFIAGILFAGTPALTGHITHFSFIPVGPAAAVRLIIPTPDNLVPLAVGSEGNNDRHAHMIPLGTNPNEGKEGFRGMLKESRLYEELKGKLSEPYYFPKSIAGNVALPGQPYQHASAWRHTFKRFDLPNEAAHAHFLAAVMSYISNFDSANFPKLAPLTLAQAFFGEPSIGVDPFPMKTSTGPYWRKKGFKKKEDLFTRDEETGEYHLIPEFRDSVQRGLDLLEGGVIVAPLVELVAKDEVRPVRKLNEYNVRLFSVLDVDYNILVRMYMMPLVVFLLKEKECSECFGQMHAASSQWTALYNYLVEPGFTKFADMDFSAFDTCHDEKVFLAVSYVMKVLAKCCGYTDSDAHKVGMLVQSMGTQVCQYKGDYFLKTKGMPSGVILTLIINSLANSLLMRIVFSELTGLPQSEFRKHVRLATVGDDNIHSFSDDIADQFTMRRAQPVYKKLGYTITPASKGDILVDSMSLEDLVFVKRKFVLWPDGFYRAPIDTDSIYKAFCFEPKGGPTTSVERLSNVFTSGLYEAYLHGETFFNEFVSEMSQLYDRHQLPYTLLTFGELNDIFLSRGLTTAFA
uniref:RdRp catalytic domain-containing protein n=1 Tax=Riboviria sp. TaxID=2585031 RepID=A0A8K1HHJ3_9VIRU|nr:hypothetical protein 1 [Riboviria sp.]